jgi:hypothetical protein
MIEIPLSDLVEIFTKYHILETFIKYPFILSGIFIFFASLISLLFYPRHISPRLIINYVPKRYNRLPK